MRSRLHPLCIAAFVQLLAVGAAHASCKSPDWAHRDFSKLLNGHYAKAFAQYVESAPLILRGRVTGANRTKDNMWAFDDKAAYEFRIQPRQIYKGSYHGLSLLVSYPLRAQKPKMATPLMGEEWIFVIQKVDGEAAVISGPTCGGLGFPVKQKRLVALLDAQVQAKHPTVKLDEACKSDAQCRAIDCTTYDNKLKSGYRPACVGKVNREVCRCMCYGCK